MQSTASASRTAFGGAGGMLDPAGSSAGREAVKACLER